MTSAPANVEDPTCAAHSGCFHCGLQVAAPDRGRYRVVVDRVARDLCCAGCEAVARAIVDAGLGDYYRHRTALPISPAQALPEFIRELPVYDAPAVQRSFVRELEGEAREALLILEGIRCAACVWLNEQHLARIPGVLAVEVNYTTQRARVRWDPRRVKLSAILRAITDIGYTAHPYDARRQDALHQRQRRAALRQLFVAGLASMQVMMYAVPGYMAGDGDMGEDIRALMRWASLLLTLPVVLYSAAPFFQGTWRDFRARRVGMDVPVALGIALAFGASVLATVSGGGEVYFDSVAMFVFFLLGGRYLEMAARRKSAAAAERLARALPAAARVLPGWPGARDEVVMAVAELVPGQYLRVGAGDAVAADGRIVEGATEADESILTGESRPLRRGVGDRLTGGTVNAGSPVIMRVEQVGQDTVLSGVVRLMDRALAEKPPLAAAADRVAGAFVAGVLVLAAGVAAWWLQADAQRALWVTVAVLVVTCPCALSLATPAALAAATGAMSRRGVLVTRGHAIETLARATHFVFDKTGTLTRGRMAVASAVSLDGGAVAGHLAAAAALEAGSAHPIARALAAAGEDGRTRALGIGHVAGRGVEGLVDGARLRLGSPEFAAEAAGSPVPRAVRDLESGGATVVALAAPGRWLAAIALEDPVREDAREVVAGLAARGAQVMLLSGDSPAAAEQVAARLGIDTVVAGATPADKLAVVEELQASGAVVAMVGDGVNDAPVLARAQVSVAMGQASQLAHESADAVLLSDRLGDLLKAVTLSGRTLRVVRQNLAWAVLYNAAALPLAAAGYVTPWMAGIGMAASSLAVVLNALRLTRERDALADTGHAPSGAGRSASGLLGAQG